MREVMLQVNGKKYAGWKDIRILRSLETPSGQFEMQVSERWDGQREPWPIREGDECVVLLGDEPVITGYVDLRSMSITGSEHAFSVAGRDKTADLIDSSIVLDSWEFVGLSTREIVARVVAPFGISLLVQPGLELPPDPRRIAINPGDTAYEVIERACRLAGIFAITDGGGSLLLTKAGAGMATTPLILGKNVLAAAADFNFSERFARYIVIGQQAGDEEISGEDAASVIAESRDGNVTRPARCLMVRAEGGVTTRQAQDRANWEADVRAANSDTVTVTVQGWEQADGSLWPVNSKAQLSLPAFGVQRQMLISEAVYSLSSAGTTTEITLRPPNAFLPQPQIDENARQEWLLEAPE